MTSSGKLYRKDLNLGCGDFYSSDWLGVDNDKDSLARVFHDLDSPYLPFKDKSVSFIIIICTIAHVKNPSNLIEECKRVAVDGVGIIPCGKRCEHHENEYNKQDLIYLTKEEDKINSCKEKYFYWIDILNEQKRRKT